MRRIAQLLILVLIAIAVVPIFLPKQIETNVERTLDASTVLIFENFNNLNKFSEWDPWTQSDSLAQKEFYSPYRGAGAGYRWELNGEVREVTIKKTEKNKWLTYVVDGYGVGGNGEMNVELATIDSLKTQVKWSFESKGGGYFSRYFNYFTQKKLIDTMNKGLDQLESILSSPIVAVPDLQDDGLFEGVRVEQFDGRKLVAVLNKTSLDKEEFETAKDESFGLLYSYLIDHVKLQADEIARPVIFIESMDTSGKQLIFYCGYPIRTSIPLDESMELVFLEASQVLVSIHRGSELEFQSTLRKMKDFARSQNLTEGKNYWLEYLNGVESVDNGQELLTKIYLPIRSKSSK